MSISRTKKCSKITDLYYLREGLIIPHDLSIFCNFPSNNTFFLYLAIHSGCIYAFVKKKNKTSNSSCVQLSDGRFIEIIYFVVNIPLKIELTICKIIHVSDGLSECILYLK